MAESLQRARTYRLEREFGWVLGGVFAALGGWWVYRGKFSTLATALLAAGVVLLLLGTFAPRALVLPARLWMKFAEALSFVMTRVILAFVYFLVLLPIGFVKRRMGWDPLERRSARVPTYWRPYAAHQRDPKHYERMF
jgi:hypothetical protein